MYWDAFGFGDGSGPLGDTAIGGSFALAVSVSRVSVGHAPKLTVVPAVAHLAITPARLRTAVVPAYDAATVP